MKIAVHVGLHRAASTALQRYLEDHRTALEAEGVFLLTDLSSGAQPSLLGVLVGDTLQADSAEAIALMVEEELERLSRTWRAVVISDENLTGLMPGLNGPAFSKLEPLVQVLRNIANRHELLPVLVLREHTAWLTSLYRIAQLRGQTIDFMTFTQEVLPPSTGFRPVVEQLSGIAAPLIHSLDGLRLDGGRRLLASLELFLACTAFPDKALGRANMVPPSILLTLHQQLAALDARIELKERPGLQRLLVRLARQNVQEAGDLQTASRVLARHAVRPTGKTAVEPFLSLRQARALLTRSLRVAGSPLASPEEIAMLQHRHAADRQWLAEHHIIFKETTP
ncbi:hypothetical protein [Aestuariivirga sp.]|uniref:hypothetical protein n=1 Tax=Aestuariivirga sp. TaxID=2650926 RepID=UPI0039E298EF